MIKLKKNKWILTIVILAVIVGFTVFFFWNNNNSQNGEDYEATRTSQSNEIDNANIENPTNTSTPQENTDTSTEDVNNTPNVIKKGVTTPQPVEEPIANFSTKIYTKDSSRQNNINITCQALNGTIVENGATFSFCNTVGPATTAKGYQKADIFDNKGQKKKGLGGGNCQISTTLYNALLAVPSLVVTERHEHSNKVPYVQAGKDAAVAYGSYDLKFRNDSGTPIKILAESDGETVSVSLIALK